MALVLVRLRLTIAARVRGSGPGASVYYATSWAIALAFGLMAATGTAIFASEASLGSALLLGAFITVSLPWLLGPILEPTLMDGTVDPRRLEQYPLSSTQQVTGLLLGALLAPTAAFTLLFSLGAVAAIGGEPGFRVAAALSAVAYTVMCVTVSRAAQAVLAESLRSRRGRDLAALVAALMVLGVYGLAMHLRSAIASISEQLSGPVGVVAAWTPPGAAAQSIIDAHAGDWSDYLLRLAVVIATILAAAAVWTWALSRRVRGDNSTVARGYRRSTHDPLPLIPHGLRPLGASPLTAAVAQQWRYFFFRSPKAIQTLIIPPVMGVMVAHSTFGGVSLAAQAAAFSALAVVVGSFNVFGYDGVGFRYLIGSGARLSTLLVGKVLTPLLYLIPLLAGFTIIEAFLQHQQAAIPESLAAGCAVLAVGIGIGAESSVRNPNDQSRVGVHRQGMFLKVLAWFTGFFVVISFGAAGWIVLSQRFGIAAAASITSACSLGLAAGLIFHAGRTIDRDPDRLLQRLAPADH